MRQNKLQYVRLYTDYVCQLHLSIAGFGPLIGYVESEIDYCQIQTLNINLVIECIILEESMFGNGLKHFSEENQSTGRTDDLSP